MKLAFTLLASTLLLPTSASGQEAAAPKRSVAEELAELNATVSRSNELLERLVSNQEATLFVRRLELASARADEAQRTLSRLQAELSALEQSRLMLTARHEQFEQAIDDAEEAVRPMMEHEFANLELELRSTEAELARLEAAVITTENELRFRRDRLVELQELLDTAIESLLRKR